jgi:hypothetical protein
MRRYKKFFFVFVMLNAFSSFAEMNLVQKYEIPGECSGIAMTMIHDTQERNFLYVASKEAGLKIYNLERAPVLIKSIGIQSLRSLHVMNLSQEGNFLYLAIGNQFGIAQQNPGFAVIDVTDPAAASVVSVWSDPALKNGTGAVRVEGNYLYLCAMKAGLMIFDISDRKDPRRISIFVPDIHFPDKIADQSKINARGLDIKDDIVYLCYDAGGLRLIDVKDKTHPREIGRYSNAALNGRPRAYNNVIVDDSLVYVTADYCGLEILRIDSKKNIQPVGWWNPWKCPGGPFQWFKSDGHANEIAFDKQNKIVFLATGKSDLNVLSVSDPENPNEILNYGGLNNGLGTWGVSRYQNEIYLSYICAFIPFQSSWTGVKILNLENR